MIQCIRHLIQAKKDLHASHPFIILQFIVFKHNQHQIAEVYQVGKELGVDRVEVKKAQLYNYSKGHPMLTDLKKLARYEVKNGSVVAKGQLYNSCRRIWTTGVITTDGELTSCCYDKHAAYKMGNLTSDKMRPAWKSDNFMKFRRRILSERSSIDICTNCGER